MRFLILVVAACLAGCPAPAPPAPVPPDASDAAVPSADASALSADAGTSCVAACANLAIIPCKEGLAANCEATCTHAQIARLTDLNTACLARARTKAAARACKTVDCP